MSTRKLPNNEGGRATLESVLWYDVNDKINKEIAISEVYSDVVNWVNSLFEESTNLDSISRNLLFEKVKDYCVTLLDRWGRTNSQGKSDTSKENSLDDIFRWVDVVWYQENFIDIGQRDKIDKDDWKQYALGKVLLAYKAFLNGMTKDSKILSQENRDYYKHNLLYKAKEAIYGHEGIQTGVNDALKKVLNNKYVNYLENKLPWESNDGIRIRNNLIAYWKDMLGSPDTSDISKTIRELEELMYALNEEEVYTACSTLKSELEKGEQKEQKERLKRAKAFDEEYTDTLDWVNSALEERWKANDHSTASLKWIVKNRVETSDTFGYKKVFWRNAASSIDLYLHHMQIENKEITEINEETYKKIKQNIERNLILRWSEYEKKRKISVERSIKDDIYRYTKRMERLSDDGKRTVKSIVVELKDQCYNREELCRVLEGNNSFNGNDKKRISHWIKELRTLDTSKISSLFG
jgi:ribosomal protein S25